MTLPIPRQARVAESLLGTKRIMATATAGLPIKLLMKTSGRRTRQMESQNLDQFFVLPYTYLHINVYIHLATSVQLWASFDPSWSVKTLQNQCPKHTWRQENTQQLHLLPITAHSRKLQQGHTSETSLEPKGAICGTSPEELLADSPRYFLLCPLIVPYISHICWPPSPRGRLGVTPLVKQVCSRP